MLGEIFQWAAEGEGVAAGNGERQAGRRLESFCAPHVLTPVGSTPLETGTQVSAPWLVSFLGPELMRQACLSGDRLGSGME